MEKQTIWEGEVGEVIHHQIWDKRGCEQWDSDMYRNKVEEGGWRVDMGLEIRQRGSSKAAILDVTSVMTLGRRKCSRQIV